MNGTSRKRAELRVDWADNKAAAFACTRWHYSKTFPPGTNNVLGVWEDGAFIGVVVFARGASRNLGERFGLEQTDCCELVRIALRAHQTPVTRILKFALRLLKQRNPGLRLVVSFADANQGHHGGVYQGAGWIYAGATPPSKAYVDETGRTWHHRQTSANGFSTEFGERRRCKKRSEVRQVHLLGKHRYFWPLDDALRERVLKLARPYPKRTVQLASSSERADTRERAASVASTAAVQTAGDGKPIAALQTNAR